MTTDINTGLPTLPEGYFWRVRETHRGSTYVRVQIRKKLFLGSKLVEWHPVQKDKVTSGSILHAAGYALQWMNQGGFDTRNNSNWQNYVGDYPPKKLES